MFEISRQDCVTLLRLRHGKANAMDTEWCLALAAEFARLGADPALGALVLTGQDRIFSAGVDLLRILDGGAGYVREFMPALRRVLRAAFAFPRPMVAAVNGAAVAGGCVLACAADRVLAADQARLGVPELLVGVPFPTGALEIMRSALAPQTLHEVLYGGELYGAAEAQRRGLVHRVVDGAALLEAAVAEAARLARMPPAAFALTKRQLRGAALRRIDAEGIALDADALAQWQDAGTHAAIRDYVAHTFKPAR